MSATCLRCNRELKLAKSVDRNLGDVCARKSRDTGFDDRSFADKYDLEFDPVKKSIEFRLDKNGVRHFNIYHAIKHHSSTSMAWGYYGSGASDFALNIVEFFMREIEKPAVVLPRADGERKKVCPSTLRIYQQFKEEFISIAPANGDFIDGDKIRIWIGARVGSLGLRCEVTA